VPLTTVIPPYPNKCPFRCDDLPRTMVKYLVMESAKKLNYFPNKNGVSKYYSPRMILHQENIDYERHCEYRIGEYVLAHDEPKRTDTNAPRALDCIYLRALDGIQEGHELLHLQTNSVIKRRKLTKMVLTPSIIKMVHRFAEIDKMPKGPKIANRADLILFDSAWIAGVDYDEELFDDDDHQPNYDEENEDEDDSYEMIEEYDGMDENELAEIMMSHTVSMYPTKQIGMKKPSLNKTTTKESTMTMAMKTTKIAMQTMCR
jgi:hypothetical protein